MKTTHKTTKQLYLLMPAVYMIAMLFSGCSSGSVNDSEEFAVTLSKSSFVVKDHLQPIVLDTKLQNKHTESIYLATCGRNAIGNLEKLINNVWTHHATVICAGDPSYIQIEPNDVQQTSVYFHIPNFETPEIEGTYRLLYQVLTDIDIRTMISIPYHSSDEFTITDESQ